MGRPKSDRFTPKGDYIRRLLKQVGYTSNESFAIDGTDDQPRIDVELVGEATRGEPCTERTIRVIAEKLAKKVPGITWEDLVDLGDIASGDKPEIASAAASAPLNPESHTPSLEPLVSITVAAHPSLIAKISREKLEDSLKTLLSEAASIVIARISEQASITISMHVNIEARDVLVRAFLWRLMQSHGVFRVEFSAPVTYVAEIVDWYFKAWEFPDEGMALRFRESIDGGERTCVVSNEGALTINCPVSYIPPYVTTRNQVMPGAIMRHCSLESSLSPDNIHTADTEWNRLEPFRAVRAPYSQRIIAVPSLSVLLDLHFRELFQPEWAPV